MTEALTNGATAFTHVIDVASTPQQIADHILSAIAVGALPVDTMLPPERELAASMAVSRSSVRIALDRLQREGFVVRRRGRGGGTFIADVSETGLRSVAQRLDDFREAQHDALEARALVHRSLATLAATRRTAEQIDTLEGLVADYRAEVTADGARAADFRFHQALAQVSGNSVLRTIAGDLDREINMGFRHDPFSASLSERAAEDHAQIVEAIVERDAQRAGDLAEQHFRHTTMFDETR